MSVAGLSRFVLAHKWLVVAVWAVVTIGSIASVSSAVGALSQDFSVPGRDGAETSKAILETYGNGGQVPPLVPVVRLPEGTTVDSPGVVAELDALFAAIEAAAPGVRAACFATTGDRAFVSADGRTTFGLVFVPIGQGFGEAPEVTAIREILTGATVAGAPVVLTGYAELESGGAGDEGGSALAETLVGGLGALVVLAWVFGSFLAIVPLLIAAVAILTTFLVLWGVTTVADVFFIVEIIVALIGLGVAIDYALLIVTRWREEREAGRQNEEAVQRAMETAGNAVVFSGLTVGVGLLALVVLPVPFLRSIGYGGLLIPLVSVLVAVTLLPFVLATVGPELDWPRWRRGSQASRGWTRWARLVVRRRWLAAGLGTALLAALLIPALSLNIGDPRADALAKSGAAADGLTVLIDAGIGAGVLLPFEVLVEGGDPAAVANALVGVDGVRGAVAPDSEAWRRDGSAVVAVLLAVDANSRTGLDALDRVRAAAGDLPGPGTVRVGGQAAQNADFIDAVYGNFPLMVALIAVVTFVLLVRAFRSLLLPLKAIVLNVLSVAAAYGVLVLVWQEGYGAGLIWGYEATGAITPFIPLVVFAFLFGLSMDYEVFILARMREEYDTTGDTDAAIARGIGFTGRQVTSAALILFLAFAAWPRDRSS